jgi:translation initiation factor 1 (eIF-1/SUI1)
LAPTKVNKYHPDFKPEHLEQAKEKKETAKDEEKEEKEPAKDPKVKSLKDKYVVIEVKNRGKKNFITTVSGLNNFSN